MIQLFNHPEADGLNKVIAWFADHNINLPGFVLGCYVASEKCIGQREYIFNTALIENAFSKVHGDNFKRCPLWPQDKGVREMVIYLVYLLENQGFVFKRGDVLYGRPTLQGIVEYQNLEM